MAFVLFSGKICFPSYFFMLFEIWSEQFHVFHFNNVEMRAICLLFIIERSGRLFPDDTLIILGE